MKLYVPVKNKHMIMLSYLKKKRKEKKRKILKILIGKF